MAEVIGQEMYRWAEDLFPICRSITGNGVRKTLRYLQKFLPELRIREVPSGTRAFDWTVPDEWNIREAYVADYSGKRVIDFKRNNLHVVSYSTPVCQIMSLDQLIRHLHTLPDQPTAIPYITSYYRHYWGFCLSEEQKQELAPGNYQVMIDSSLAPGNLTYGELILPGESEEEILLSTYVCHPSMANNELSGPCVTAALAKWLQDMPNRRYTYRILFLVETIGAITYLSRHHETMKKNTKAGWVLTCCGDDNAYSYLASKQGDTLADRASLLALQDLSIAAKHYSFLDRGSDERQYGSVGIDLPVASLMRTKYAEYPEYHTSLDDLSFISPQGLGGAFSLYQKAISLLEQEDERLEKGTHSDVVTSANDTIEASGEWADCWEMLVPCEPQLGKRGLYPDTSTKESHDQVIMMLNVIAYADGTRNVLELARDIKAEPEEVLAIIKRLAEASLLRKTNA